MPIIRTPRTDPLPPRWRKLIDLLRVQPMTMTELAQALGVTPKTARTYLSESAKHLGIEVKAEGPWGQTRYRVEK
jgi:DNA-directed RNA polymerase specialized sigma24 family protein